MKKLLIATLATAAVGSAFATAPTVYQYKASIKQMNLKVKKNIKYDGGKFEAYIKYQSTAALKGYLIVDSEGATSTAIQTLAATGNSLPGTRNAIADYGRNAAFLVVQNSKAEKDVRFPKILPAVFDAKWIDDGIASKKNGLAEGYLYVGGDVVVGNGVAGANQVRESLDIYDGVLAAPTRTPAKGFIGDYCWTSIWLFGMYNGPFFEKSALGLDNAQQAIDGAQGAAELKQPYNPGFTYFFHDTWMNGSGLGKWTSGKVNKPCCGVSSGKMGPKYAKELALKTLDSLTGNLKGGIFLCTENGVVEGTAGDTIENKSGVMLVWEDQFFTQRWDKTPANPGAWVAAGDVDQIDLWQDGDLELNTSDVITGTWSIKFTDKLKKATVTEAELKYLGATDTDGNGKIEEDADSLDDLLAAIKGAAIAINKDVLFANGKEIWDEASPDHEKVPMITPQFSKYYGFANYK